MDTIIVCIGNELVCDDGIGIRVGRVLDALPLPPKVAVQFRPNLSLDLLEVIEQYKRVVLVDATSTGVPVGSCTVLSGAQLESWACEAPLAHGLSIAEVIGVARRLLRKEALDTVHFVGVEGRCFDRYDTELSPEVSAALPLAVEAVLTILGGDLSLLVKARAECERARCTEPSISDILSIR